MNEFNFKEWQDKYCNNEVVDLKEYFNEEDFKLLKKLGIVIKDKIYTEYELECLDMDVIQYYKDDQMDEEELKECVELPENVTREEYNKLIEKIDNISKLKKF